MISVSVAIDDDGCLSSLDMSGHAAVSLSGESVACAAVTGIVRAVGDALVAHGIQADGSSSGPGTLSIRVIGRRGPDGGWLRGVSDVLVGGIERIVREHPGEVSVVVRRHVGAMMEE